MPDSAAASQSGPQAEVSTSPWWVYIVRCVDGTLYTGIARNLDARLRCHNAGKGARYTRSRRPVEPVYSEAAHDRRAALKREYEIRRRGASYKRALIAESVADPLKLLDIDGSQAARKVLATELGCPPENMGDSSQMNMWLHKTVLQKIAENGGRVAMEPLD